MVGNSALWESRVCLVISSPWRWVLWAVAWSSPVGVAARTMPWVAPVERRPPGSGAVGVRAGSQAGMRSREWCRAVGRGVSAVVGGPGVVRSSGLSCARSDEAAMPTSAREGGVDQVATGTPSGRRRAAPWKPSPSARVASGSSPTDVTGGPRCAGAPTSLSLVRSGPRRVSPSLTRSRVETPTSTHVLDPTADVH
jgi:hypothetical protein